MHKVRSGMRGGISRRQGLRSIPLGVPVISRHVQMSTTLGRDASELLSDVVIPAVKNLPPAEVKHETEVTNAVAEQLCDALSPMSLLKPSCIWSTLTRPSPSQYSSPHIRQAVDLAWATNPQIAVPNVRMPVKAIYPSSTSQPTQSLPRLLNDVLRSAVDIAGSSSAAPAIAHCLQVIANEKRQGVWTQLLSAIGTSGIPQHFTLQIDPAEYKEGATEMRVDHASRTITPTGQACLSVVLSGGTSMNYSGWAHRQAKLLIPVTVHLATTQNGWTVMLWSVGTAQLVGVSGTGVGCPATLDQLQQWLP